ncbi:MAG: HU family DNA-binding protein [Muribaculaceae bacterium]|nr:HU family DNA-binding protein [Muribaculaceae bacterium]
MKTTLTLNDLAQLFAQRASLDNAEAENFIRLYFNNIATALQTDGQVTIDGFGTLSRNPETNTVSFIASPELAEKVNEPFSFFEAVELDDKYVDAEPQQQEMQPEPETTQPVETEEHEAQPEPEPVPQNEAEPVEDPEPEPESKAEQEPQPEPESKAETEPQPEPESIAETEPETEPEPETVQEVKKETITYRVAPKRVDDEDEEEEEHEEHHGGHHLPWWIPGLIGLFIGFAIGYSINLVTLPETDEYDMDEEEQTTELTETVAVPDELPVTLNDTITTAVSDEEAMSDTIKLEPQHEDKKAPAAEVIKDTVRAGYYLTSMARKHYGKTDFWCYIYEENKDKLRNPNQIAAGTEVIIPPASKYGIDPNDPESIARAKAKIAEINRKYSK